MTKKKKDTKVEYEAFRRGPLIFERYGREIGIRSEWKPGEYEKYINNVKNNLPDDKISINNKITELKSIIQKYQPLELLQTTTTRNILGASEPNNERIQNKVEMIAEYAQSFILAFERQDHYERTTDSVIDKFNTLIEEIIIEVYRYFANTTSFQNLTKIEKDYRINSISRFLFLRGDSIPQHHNEMITDIFSGSEAFLYEHLGIKIDEIFKAFHIIESQIQNNIDKTVRYVKFHNQIQREFTDFIKKGGEKERGNEEELFTEFASQPELQRRIDVLSKLAKGAPSIVFEFSINNDLPLALLDFLSAQFGDNQEFRSFKKSPLWPTNNSIIYEKPLIKENGHYYCFLPSLLARNIGLILDRFIHDTDSDYYDKTFQKKRAKYLEDKSLKYTGDILPGADLYPKMYYHIDDEGIAKRVETDGIIIFDNNLFILECKAGGLSLSAKRGSIESIKDHAEELIDQAYKQSLRTKKYIEESQTPVFEDESGSLVLKISDKERYKNIFLINTTFENLGALSTHLSSAKEMGFVQGTEWPYSVFINDLRVISEITESPSIFIHYLKRRTRANDYPQFKSSDELDYYVFYLREGLYFDDNRLANTDKLSVFGYTDSLDQYYEYLAGRAPFVEKPTVNLPKSIKDVIFDIEKSGKFGFTSITTFLLDLSIEGARVVIHNLNEITKKYLEDKSGHQFTMTINDNISMVVLGVCDTDDIEYIREMRNYCRLKMYHTKRSKCAFIVKLLLEDGQNSWEFELIEKEWTNDEYLEKELEIFKEKKKVKAGNNVKQIRRNDKCYCGSGFKYKHCCGK